MAVNEEHKSQIKSKERVSERGEVFTAEREVNAMLDLVANECLRPDSRFLEPACGDGNFLSAILTYIIHSGFISGYQNRYGDNLKPPTNVYHRMTA